MKYVRGFTLIELIIVISVIGIMASALAPIMQSSLRAYDNTLNDLIVLDKLRYATERLAREIREVKDNDTTANTNFAFTSMSTSAPVFTRDYNTCADSTCNTITTVTRTVTVGNAGSTVTLAYSDMSGTGAQVLTDQVSSLAFAYFDKDGVSTASTVDVRYVQISLTLNQNGNDYTQRTRVELRNR